MAIDTDRMSSPFIPQVILSQYSLRTHLLFKRIAVSHPLIFAIGIHRNLIDRVASCEMIHNACNWSEFPAISTRIAEPFKIEMLCQNVITSFN